MDWQGLQEENISWSYATIIVNHAAMVKFGIFQFMAKLLCKSHLHVDLSDLRYIDVLSELREIRIINNQYCENYNQSSSRNKDDKLQYIHPNVCNTCKIEMMNYRRGVGSHDLLILGWLNTLKIDMIWQIKLLKN